MLTLIAAAREQVCQVADFTELDLHGLNKPIRILNAWKTVFITTKGHYEYLAMPNELRVAPSVFQAIVNEIFQDMKDIFDHVY